MSRAELTVGLPVRNGERFLEAAARSILDQRDVGLRLVIGDNASTDGTDDICRRLAREDPRVEVRRSEDDIGAVANFLRVLDGVDTPFVTWAADDDLRHHDLYRTCLDALAERPDAVLAHTRAESIDAQGDVTRAPWGEPVGFRDPDVVTRFRCALAPPRRPIPLQMFAVIRRDVLDRTGGLRPIPDFDRALVAELALHGPFVEIDRVQFSHREHAARLGPRLSADPSAAPALLGSAQFAPHWRLLARHVGSIRRRPVAVPGRPLLATLADWSWRHRNELLADPVDAATRWPVVGTQIERSRRRRHRHRFERRRARFVGWVADHTPDDARIVLVDDDVLDIGNIGARQCGPLAPVDGPDGSIPATGARARCALGEVRDSGATHLVVAWTAGWVLDHHVELADDLHGRHRHIASSEGSTLFDLR